MKFTEFLKKLFGKHKQKKLGLALGSGGAKGMALIGALKAFEEYGVKFDMVAGTSIGSIVGGMYAAGHDTSEMFGFLKEYDVTNPKTLIMMKLKGQTVESVLDGVLGGAVIEDFKLPFWAVACDLDSGEELDINCGSAAKALAASSAIPPIFKPVTRENRRLVDGAFINSVPADVLKANGADVVIAVSLTEQPTNASSKAVLDKAYKGNGVKLADRYEKGVTAADYLIKPELTAYSSARLSGFKEMYAEGYRAAIEAMPNIIELLRANKLIDKKQKSAK